MKRFIVAILLPIVVAVVNVSAQTNLLKKAEHIIETAIGESAVDSAAMAAGDSLYGVERVRRDSIRLAEMALQLQEMKLNEIVLRSRLEALDDDSLRLAEQRERIDSLRGCTPGAPVVVEGDTLFTLYAESEAGSAFDRADRVIAKLAEIGRGEGLDRDSVRTTDYGRQTNIHYGKTVILSVTEQDALWEGMERDSLARHYAMILDNKIRDLKDDYNFFGMVKRVALFIFVLVAQYLLFKLTNYLFRKLRRRIIRFKRQRLQPIIIRDYELLNTRQIGRILIFLVNILRYLVLLTQLTFSVPVLFAIFPQTEKLAFTIFRYIFEPVKMVATSVVDYIPKLFIILVIWYCIKYIIKGIEYIAKEIENEKLKISGFYPDWAKPTFNIIRFLLYAFMIAMIYPFLPGSDSGVFQGISVFVGLIVSLGSSTVIGNIIAGLVITYMRPFKVGDRIKLDDTTGNVIEKTPFVTRLRTPKNEVVTIPNSFIMSSHTVNYSASARQFGLIIHTTVTIGYDAPWRQVHQLLINAARMTDGVVEHPKPFVLETELNDYYPCYQINAYIKDADRLGEIMSELHQNIQDVFNEAGVEIMSPHYYAGRDGSASTIPADYLNREE
ncbi:MAG: mechanosensitive ion channel family protein [Paramuribaculum sp.]|nr:mechanosensitive ion channel family protein [Paramuribaculum sp.]MDE6303797.1 mechanosensitive ion channel family protein [Paramuribaculum sp.]